MTTQQFIVLFSIMTGSVIRSVPPTLLFLASPYVTNSFLHWAMIIIGSISFANTVQVAVKTWRKMQQFVD